MNEHESKLVLKERPTLADLQQYVKEMEIERGFDHESVLQQCLLLGEEVGELYKAIRKTQGVKMDVTVAESNIGHEMADVLIYLCALANRYGIDLEEMFRKKEAINKTRTWN